MLPAPCPKSTERDEEEKIASLGDGKIKPATFFCTFLLLFLFIIIGLPLALKSPSPNQPLLRIISLAVALYIRCTKERNNEEEGHGQGRN